MVGAPALALTCTPRVAETAAKERSARVSKLAKALCASSGFVVARFAMTTIDPGVTVRARSAAAMPGPNSAARFDVKLAPSKASTVLSIVIW